MSDHLQALIPEPQPAEMLEQLALDYHTAGLAKLTQRLISALKIPMHARASSDQSFGGVSDITNRGNIDRLLLSELAHDDLSLMVRLANNEAMYLRREELPAKHNRQRFILIDTSIKMWGTPRIYAIATALAAINNSKTLINTFALEGSLYSEINLSTAQGIKNTLNQLSAALDSADALTAFTKAFPLNKQQEYFLITDEQLFYTPSFQYAFANLRNAHGFLVIVNRAGQLQMFRYTGASRKLIHSILLDLPGILNSIKNPTGLPAFLMVTPAPIYFPSHKIVANAAHLYETTFGVVAITQEKRVLYWQDKSTGAKELLSYIPSGKYHFGHDKDVSMIYILLHEEQHHKLTIYKIGTVGQAIRKIEYKHHFKINEELSFLFNPNNKLFLIDNRQLVFSINTADSTSELETAGPSPTGSITKFNRLTFDLNKIKRFINNGYSTFNNVQKIYVGNGVLKIDTRVLELNANQIFLRESKALISSSSLSSRGPEIVNLPGVDYKLSKFVFANGSEAVVDSRGLLHLRSADRNLKEVTIVLILGRQTACWASDGRVCGSSYFTDNNRNIMPVQEFYTNYIQSFIHALS